MKPVTAPAPKPFSQSEGPKNRPPELATAPPIAILGVPFDRVTTRETIGLIGRMVASGHPHYAATANVDFIVQALDDTELRRILADADLVLCDGMPLVWASRYLGNPLPERVAGADLVPELLAEAERQGWRVFFLGGTDASVAKAAENTRARHPRLKLVGAYSPPFKSLLNMDHEDVLGRVREAKPDILLVAFGCPKQEKWINMHFRALGVPFCIGVGATIDFLAGSVRRAPGWMRTSGLEWIFRLFQEPRRLFRRYVTDLFVFGRAILRQSWLMRSSRSATGKASPAAPAPAPESGAEVVALSGRLDAAAVNQSADLWARLGAGGLHVLLDLSKVEFADSTGMGMLVRLRKRLAAGDRQLVLVAPRAGVTRALELMRLAEFFPVVVDVAGARELVRGRAEERNVLVAPRRESPNELLAWQGDIVATNAEEVWKVTQAHLEAARPSDNVFRIGLAGVRFVDSTGVGLMVRVRKEGRQRGLAVKFTSPTPSVLGVLRILRMDAVLLE